MNKSINNYLDSVIELYKEYLKNRELIPLEFNFPAFKVTKGIFNFYAIEALSEKVRIGVDSGMYGLQKYSDEINYDELIDYSLRKKMGLTTPKEDESTGFLIEKVLPNKIKQDKSITANEARKSALLGACAKTMEYKLQELINFEYFKEETKIDKKLINENQNPKLLLGEKEKIDFLATLVSLKEVLPQVYKKVWESLSERQELINETIKEYLKIKNPKKRKDFEIVIKQNSQIAQLISNLKEEAVNPTEKILERALETDYSLSKNFIEKYPKTMKNIIKNNKNFINSIKL
jgi:hypothetical protein